MLTLTAISMERFQAICYPLRFSHASSRKTSYIIIVIWLLSLAIPVVELVVLHLVPSLPEYYKTELLKVCKPWWDYHSQSVYQLLLATVLFFLPLGVMAFAYIAIAVELWKTAVPTETPTCKDCLSKAE